MPFCRIPTFLPRTTVQLVAERYCHAQLSHLMAMINRDPKGKPPELSDFMPFFNRADGAAEIEDDGVADYLAKR